MKEIKSEVKAEKEKFFKDLESHVLTTISEKQGKLLKGAQEKEASSWLSSFPLKKHGFALNAQEFRDAIALRYGWVIKDTPLFCACGKSNSIDHTLTCDLGGYTIMRHNALRDSFAELLEEVCIDVKTEPGLLPVTNNTSIKGNKTDGARADISARSVWSPCEKTFFDVQVSHPNATSHVQKSFDTLYKEIESSKKNEYNDRILNIEKASFVPLAFSTTGGCGKEATKLIKHLSNKIANKRQELYSQVVSFIRTKLRFSLLKSTLIAIRGVRGKQRKQEDLIAYVDFSLLPRNFDL